MHKNVLSHLARHPTDRFVSKAIVMNPIIKSWAEIAEGSEGSKMYFAGSCGRVLLLSMLSSLVI